LWAKACRDHGKAIKRYRSVLGTNKQDDAFAATWELYGRVFDHLVAAFVMSTVYVLALVGIARAYYYYFSGAAK
jgi:hypothetical protein